MGHIRSVHHYSPHAAPELYLTEALVTLHLPIILLLLLQVPAVLVSSELLTTAGSWWSEGGSGQSAEPQPSSGDL